jgi:hypothetical protein
MIAIPSSSIKHVHLENPLGTFFEFDDPYMLRYNVLYSFPEGKVLT